MIDKDELKKQQWREASRRYYQRHTAFKKSLNKLWRQQHPDIVKKNNAFWQKEYKFRHEELNKLWFDGRRKGWTETQIRFAQDEWLEKRSKEIQRK